MKASDTLQTALDLVTGDRNRQHGDNKENHQYVADLWSAYKGVEFTAHDIPMMMVLLKVARTKTGENNPDDYVDMAGYSGLAGELASHE